MKKYVLALDQGTTSSRAVLFNKDGEMTGIAQEEIRQIYPQPGWVEHDPVQIWQTQIKLAQEVLKKTGVKPEEIASIGIANQRETVVLWNKNTGKPVYNAIVWQCRRSASLCDDIKESGLSGYIQESTGLVTDAYFSATKIKWIFDHVKGVKEKAEKGEILFGNIDTWLIWNLTGGKVHATDVSNASRTMLYNIKELRWDEKILEHLGIPFGILPDVKPSSHVYGYTDNMLLDGAEIPIGGAAGDQQAALFGQACFQPGMAKNTYGTGCFMLMNTGKKRITSSSGLITTIAWSTAGQVEYALEGSIFIAGAVVQWLRDGLGIIENAGETEGMASAVESTGGVYFVPAFTGLGAPYWDMYARGALIGLTRDTRLEHIVRAALESIAYQTRDVLEAMQQDSEIHLQLLKVDGGAVKNNFLMQFQSDILGVEVIRPQVSETTALGAAYLAGLAAGFWKDKAEMSSRWKADKKFTPNMETEYKEKLYLNWKRAVGRSLKWDG